MRLERLKTLEKGTKVFVDGYNSNGIYQSYLGVFESISMGNRIVVSGVEVKRIDTFAPSAITKIYRKVKKPKLEFAGYSCVEGTETRKISSNIFPSIEDLSNFYKGPFYEVFLRKVEKK